MVPTVAIIGASNDRGKFGNKAVRAHLQAGYTVYPVNPRETEIEGLKVFHDLDSVPDPVDRISMYVPPKVGLAMLDRIARKQPKELYLNPGTESPELVQKAEEAGLQPIQACSIIAAGVDPAELEQG